MTAKFDVFDKIYQDGGWSGRGSGPGSSPGANADYLRLVQTLINHSPEIRTVLDIGCGDWQLMRCIDLHDVNYTGIDVVRSVIERNHAQFAKPNIEFKVSNPVTDPLPEAELIIIKDVLQHLPTALIQIILERVRQHDCWALITNDYAENSGPDIEIGGYRPLNLSKAPFNLSGVTVAAYSSKRTILI